MCSVFALAGHLAREMGFEMARGFTVFSLVLFACKAIAKQHFAFLHEPLGVLSRPVNPIGHPGPVQTTIISLISLKANRIHLSSQSQDPPARTSLHHPNLGRSCARRWSEGRYRSGGYSNGFRVGNFCSYHFTTSYTSI